jgi:tetratricopeptide (TPR) repeat protein
MNEETIEFDIEFLTQKISENPRSPLFARLADFYLHKEQTVEALSLCKEGLENYPDYYAGYIVLGKVHTVLKEYSKARTAFATAKRLAPFNQMAPQLMRSLPSTPDESERTTDENYFAPSMHAAEEQLPQQEIAAPAGMVSDEELSYTHSAESTFDPTPAYIPAPTGQFPSFDEYAQQNIDRIDATPSMALDEYLSLSAPSESPRDIPEISAEQHPHSEPVASEENVFTPLEPVSELIIEVENPLPEMPAVEEPIVLPDAVQNEEPVLSVQEEPVFEQSVSEPEPEPDVIAPQSADEPEIVFTSPEQAQLFAEETETVKETPAPAEPTIDDLAERLQHADRIVPEENYRPAEPLPVEEPESQSFETEMVTPTLAEIYASQGEYTAAIQAYEILMFTQPGKTAEFQQRVKELQRLQMEKDGTM